MTRLTVSLWKRPRAGLLTLSLTLSLACVLALSLAACGTSAGASDQTSGTPNAATASTGAGGSGNGTLPTATPGSSGGSSGGGSSGTTTPPFFFTVKATASNSSSDYTIIDNVVSNGFSDLALFVTANWNPDGSGGVYDDHALGVFYIGSPTNKWAIYHEDHSPYILNASYNVWVRQTTQPGTFIWHANSSNSAGDYTVIDNPATNNNPNAVVLITHNWNPGGGIGVYDNHPLGVFYINSKSKWAIFHQDLAGYTPNASYNVYAASSNGTTKFVQHTCAATCVGDFTTINSPASNGKPSAIVFATANWNPGGSGGVYDNHHIGVFYSGSYHAWAIYHQDKAAYVPSSSYNVMIPQPGE